MRKYCCPNKNNNRLFSIIKQFVLILLWSICFSSHFYAIDNSFLISWESCVGHHCLWVNFFPFNFHCTFWNQQPCLCIWSEFILLLVNILHAVLSFLDGIFLSFLLFWWIDINEISINFAPLLETTEELTFLSNYV